MTAGNLNLIESLMNKVGQMQEHDLQKLNEMARIILEANSYEEEEEEIDEETWQAILEADKDIDAGNFVTREELFAEYKHLL